ncbi:hypothetical protein SAMN05421747_12072 [Parapedobacter composti]|uniref:LPXTG-motif cell wall anchor domain-containing protein n=1 Tax=Parapedobacter composti TaxID=623281 RepID=A0A1I1LNR3_9SPHI|nr:hypothetical protein [Parapedobacter composti]SFC71090.1 hypothetical protein SAMN05421747_12072 [Parapedobacter composti]
MHCILALLFVFFSAYTLAQADTTAYPADPWPTYGYIALGAAVIVAAVIVLVRRQYRKFNE